MLTARFIVSKFCINVLSIISLAMMVLGAGVVSGQNYPNRPIRIVASEIGGGSDNLARLIAQGISGPIDQAVVVENRSSSTTADIVARAVPDGHTLLLIGSSLWLSSFMRDKVTYDVTRDFSPVSLVTTSPSILVVHPSLPVTSVRELVALAKTKPGVLNYASGAIGAQSHLAPELFKVMAGVDIVRVPYKGAGPGVNALVAGEVQMMIASASVMPHIKSGKLRALAVTSAQPSALAPDLPTVASSGVPGYESVSNLGLFAPAKTPTTAIRRLNQEIVRFLHTTAAKERILSSLGLEAVGSSPTELTAKAKSEMARLGKLIRDLGIREE